MLPVWPGKQDQQLQKHKKTREAHAEDVSSEVT